MTIEEYLTEHSLQADFVKSLGWTWKDGDTTIAIPIYDADRKLLYKRYRHLEGQNKFSTDKDSHPALYCIHKIKELNTVVLCEGEPDAARLWQEKIPAITGTSGVKTFSTKLAEPLKGKKVLICLDTDEAGQSAVEHYYQILATAGATPSIIELPSEFKDVSEYFTAGNSAPDFNHLKRYESLEDWQEAHEPEDFAMETADDILNTTIDPERWLLDKVIPIEGLCFFVGPEATAKSFHALCIANSIATGTPWLNKFEVKQKTKVLIIDKENTKRRTQDRLRGLKITGKDIFWLKAPQKLDIADPESVDGFSDFIKSVARKVKKNKIGFIIIDSFTDLLTGEENDRSAIQDFVDSVRQLFPGISIMALHHAGKIMPGSRRPTSQMARGSTNIMAQCYTAFHTEPVRKSKTEFTIEQTKAGDSLKMNKFIIELKSEPDPLNPNETLVTDIVYVGEALDKEEVFAETYDAVKLYLEQMRHVMKSEFIEDLMADGYKKGTLEKVIKEMKDDNVIKMDWSKAPGQKQKKEITWLGESVENDSDVVYDD